METQETRAKVWVIPQSSLSGKRETALELDKEGNRLQGGKGDIRTYKRMLRDPGISYPLHLLKMSIGKSRLVYTNPNKDIEKFVIENLQELSDTISRDALRALEFGFAPFERRFEQYNGMIYYKEFIALDPEFVTILFNPETQGFNGIEQQVSWSAKIVSLPPMKCFVFTHDKEFSNLYGHAQIDYAYIPWLLDKEFWRYHGVALQEYGLPTLLARAPEGKREVDIRGEAKVIDNSEFMRILGESVRSDAVIVLPSGEEWQLSPLFEKRTVYWDFNKDHEFLDIKKALAILVPPEVYKEGGGSYAKAQQQSFWFEQSILSILDELTKQVMRYIIKPIINLNFFDGRVEPPYGTLHGEPMTLAFKELAQALLKSTETKDKIIDWRTLMLLMRLPVTEEKDEQLDELSVTDIPQNLRTLEEFCRKYFNKGIELGKKELAFTGFVPLTQEDNTMLSEEARKLQYVFKKTDKPEMLKPMLGAVFGRLRASGRQRAIDFFFSEVSNGKYSELVTKGESDELVTR